MNYADKIADVQNRIRVSAAKSGRRVEEISLIVVSKTQPVEAIRSVYSLGVRDFGENYVQELCEKAENLKDLSDIRWHLIGPLQSNKLKKALEVMHEFHALSDLSMAPKLKSTKAYLQINVDEESTKSGIRPAQAEEWIKELKANCPSFCLKGLMCIPNPENDFVQRRNVFKKMHLLRLRCQNIVKEPLLLSMGMTDDFEIAIEEGADVVRVGRLIFGERVRKESSASSQV